MRGFLPDVAGYSDGYDARLTLCPHVYYGSAQRGVELLDVDLDAYVCELCWGQAQAAGFVSFDKCVMVSEREAARTIGEYRRRDWPVLVQGPTGWIPRER